MKFSIFRARAIEESANPFARRLLALHRIFPIKLTNCHFGRQPRDVHEFVAVKSQDGNDFGSKKNDSNISPESGRTVHVEEES